MTQIAVEIANGEGLALSAAARLLPGRNGHRVHVNTALRWVFKGAKARDGRTVKLDACRVGSAWITTKAAVARFVAALSEPPAPRAEQLRRNHADVEAELDAIGL